MRFNIFHSSEIDPIKWNARIEAQKSEIYNEYHYLNACTLNNWYGIIWGDYEKILPFYQKKKWGIIPYVCMPPFCQKFDNSHLSIEEFREVISFFKENYWLVDYQFSKRWLTDDFTERKNFILSNLDGKKEMAFQNYSSLLKKNLGKAKLLINQLDGKDEIIFFLARNEAFKNNVAPKFSKQFERLYDCSHIKRYQYTIRMEGQIEAVLIAPSFKHQTYILFPFSSKLGKKHQAMSVLIDELVKETEIHVVNFEGSSIDSIARFYEQFGAKMEIYWSLNWEKYHFLRF